MNNFLRAGLLMAVLAFVFGTLTASETRAQGGNSEVLRRMELHYRSLQTLQANVKMEKLNSQIDETDTYEGEVWYIPSKGGQMALRLDWKKPEKENLVVINGQYRLFRPRLNVEYQGTVDKAKNSSTVAGPLSFMSMSKAELSKNFDVTFVGREVVSGATGTSHLILKPKTRQKYKSAELWVDDNGMPVQAKIVENNNDTTTVLLSDLKKNVTINTTSIFTIDTPKNTKVIK